MGQTNFFTNIQHGIGTEILARLENQSLEVIQASFLSRQQILNSLKIINVYSRKLQESYDLK